MSTNFPVIIKPILGFRVPVKPSIGLLSCEDREHFFRLPVDYWNGVGHDDSEISRLQVVGALHAIATDGIYPIVDSESEFVVQPPNPVLAM